MIPIPPSVIAGLAGPLVEKFLPHVFGWLGKKDNQDFLQLNISEALAQSFLARLGGGQAGGTPALGGDPETLKALDRIADALEALVTGKMYPPQHPSA